MIFGAYFTGNKWKPSPVATTKVGGEKIRWSKNPSNRLRMIPKRVPQGDFDVRKKLPPSVTRKVGGNKNRGRKTHPIYIESP